MTTSPHCSQCSDARVSTHPQRRQSPSVSSRRVSSPHRENIRKLCESDSAVRWEWAMGNERCIQTLWSCFTNQIGLLGLQTAAWVLWCVWGEWQRSKRPWASQHLGKSLYQVSKTDVSTVVMTGKGLKGVVQVHFIKLWWQAQLAVARFLFYKLAQLL